MVKCINLTTCNTNKMHLKGGLLSFLSFFFFFFKSLMITKAAFICSKTH